jgi:hypothetical protein
LMFIFTIVLMVMNFLVRNMKSVEFLHSLRSHHGIM